MLLLVLTTTTVKVLFKIEHQQQIVLNNRLHVLDFAPLASTAHHKAWTGGLRSDIVVESDVGEGVHVHVIPVLDVILSNVLGVGIMGAIGLTHQL